MFSADSLLCVEKQFLDERGGEERERGRRVGEKEGGEKEMTRESELERKKRGRERRKERERGRESMCMKRG